MVLTTATVSWPLYLFGVCSDLFQLGWMYADTFKNRHCMDSRACWWSCWFSIVIYPIIFTFLPFHSCHWSTAMHHTDVTSHVSLCNCSCITFIRPITSCSIWLSSLIWWTDDLQTSLLHSHFLVYLMCPIVDQLVTSHCTMQSGTYCCFISDEACA